VKRVLVITGSANPKGSSFRLRIQQILPLLRERGFECEVRHRPRFWLTRRRLMRAAGGYHAVLLQKKMLPPGEARLLRKHARRILLDVDDAVMVRPRAMGWWAAWRRRRRFEATAAVADFVIAGNRYLGEVFASRGAEALVLPTVVDPAHYRVKEHGPTSGPRLVWIGSRSTLGYLRQYLPVLEAAARRVPGLRLVVIADETLREAPLPVDFHPWSFETEADALCSADIGIAPTPCDRWTLGKCGFKIVQYMAAGLPVIASPVGANEELVREGRTGFLPRRPEDWAEAAAALAGDVEMRRRFGSEARRIVEAELHLGRAADAWTGVLER
jgi:glycosyltransferase involved in cell wall biosynthesis